METVKKIIVAWLVIVAASVIGMALAVIVPYILLFLVTVAAVWGGLFLIEAFLRSMID